MEWPFFCCQRGDAFLISEDDPFCLKDTELSGFPTCLFFTFVPRMLLATVLSSGPEARMLTHP